MQELSFYILCLVGIIYLLWRMGNFLKTFLHLIWKAKKVADKSTLTKF